MTAEKIQNLPSPRVYIFRWLRLWYMCVNIVTASWDKLRLVWFGGSIRTNLSATMRRKCRTIATPFLLWTVEEILPRTHFPVVATELFPVDFFFYSQLFLLAVKNKNKRKNTNTCYLIWRQSYWYWLQFFYVS